MAVALGTNGRVAIKKAAEWGTAVALGANDRIPFVSAAYTPNVAMIEDDDINDSGGRGVPHVGNRNIDGPLVINGEYRQPGHMLLNGMSLGGTEGAPVESPTGVYTHIMKMRPDLGGKFFTYGVDWGGADVWTYASTKVANHLIDIPSSGKVQETFDLLGAGLTKGGDSSGWTYKVDPTNGGTIRALHRHHTLRANAHSGSALGSSDVQPATSMQIEISRNMTQDFTSGGNMDEPAQGDFWNIAFRVSFFGADAAKLALFRSAYDDETRLKADLVLDYGKVIEGTAENYKRTFYFPKLAVTEAPLVIDGPGPIAFSVVMTAHQAASDPAGFPTGYVEALIQEWVNDQADDPMA